MHFTFMVNSPVEWVFKCRSAREEKTVREAVVDEELTINSKHRDVFAADKTAPGIKMYIATNRYGKSLASCTVWKVSNKKNHPVITEKSKRCILVRYVYLNNGLKAIIVTIQKSGQSPDSFRIFVFVYYYRLVSTTRFRRRNAAIRMQFVTARTNAILSMCGFALATIKL